MRTLSRDKKKFSSETAVFYFSVFLSAATFILILAGGLVTSHEAGLAVPDWPTSYGQWFPPMVGNIFWEHGHRMIAGTVGILTFAAAILIQRNIPDKAIVRLSWIAFCSVLLQALLGGLTVIFMLPPAVSIAHAAFAQTFFCITIAMVFLLYRRVTGDHFLTGQNEALIIRLRKSSLVTAGLLYVQLILGAMARHTGYGVTGHVVFGFIVLVHMLMVSERILRFHDEIKPLAGAAIIFAGLGMTQIFLGIGSFIFTRMLERGYSPSLGEVVLTAAHQSTGALILGLSVLIHLMVRR